MPHRRLPWLLALASLAATGCPLPQPPPEEDLEPAVLVYALNDRNEMLVFDFEDPAAILERHALAGLPEGEALVAVTFLSSGPHWPSAYALGTSGVLWRISLPDLGVTPLVGPVSPAPEGTAFWIDREGDDRVHVYSDTGHHLRIELASGAVTVRAPLVPPLVGPQSVYGLDPATDALVQIDRLYSTPTQTAIGPLGVDVGAPGAIWWPLTTALDDCCWNMLVAALRPPGVPGSHLYLVDLATGAAIDRGPVGAAETLLGLDWRWPGLDGA